MSAKRKVEDFILEIGAEEIPSSYLKPASEQMLEEFSDFLNENSIDSGKIGVYYTPRRLTIFAYDLSTHQKERKVQTVGPPLKFAYKDGKPTPALIGFAKSCGVRLAEIKTVKLERGEYIAAERVEKGIPTKKLLKEFLPEFITKINFPKSMRWGRKKLRFARPIRWLLALYGSKVIDFTIDGLKSNRFTYGQRFLSSKRVLIRNLKEYKKKLKNDFVIVSQHERMSIIKTEIEKKTKKMGGRVLEDRELLDEVSNLTEYPKVIVGKVERLFLDLPKDVIVAAMKEHQRYFSVVDAKGNLLPYFVAIVNGGPKDFRNIIRENENILAARLSDAKFYWEVDSKLPLSKRVEELKGIIWQEGLGNLYEKTERLVALADSVSSILPKKSQILKRAALLSKADQVTSMIRDGKEFTKLEGKIGKEYALLSGEEKDVAEAIYEQYLPRYSGDELPKTKEGALLSIIDKLDTIVGFFIVGNIPSGSADPFGLRRLASGIISILLDKSFEISLKILLSESLRIYKKETDEIKNSLYNFFKYRIKCFFEDLNFRYDLVDAVLETDFDDVNDVKLKIEALEDLRSSANFEKLVIGQKRVANILKGVSPPPPVEPSVFTEEGERNLYEKVKEIEPKFFESINGKDYKKSLNQLLALRKPIDRLFDEVLIMTEDENLRTNRLALVRYAAELFKKVADFSKVVLEGD